ncbi:flavin-containing monooxygenase [Parendozoicomonas haliclonae]|uniref:4-hydroxyacetophenone monooxygenase n=1 Tax=Parendozoicomonas haliclonae TaxID=1960125 RepID=A0A1X7API0_9GAMM|nr:NAD(P)/FAD-dependent oxidoreductase [Parendozoicomonas haliclonae]SMA50231.1 4-hydroxyacetophenone monooxygenase [Parendozoicomonas haliclonae]
MTAQAAHKKIIIIGSGFSGLGMAIRLQQKGIHEFLILERASEVGGTWRDNTYPGCACDVMSHLYSFSFEPNPDWSRKYSSWKEIGAYLKRCAKKYNLYDKIRFGQTVRKGRFIEGRSIWEITSDTGEVFTADFVVAAPGPLSNPAIPDIPGKDSFQGQMFHSANWNHDYDLTDKRVAVIGTGASAIQFVPEIAKKVQSLKLFQRTPPWILPKPDRKFLGIEKFLFRWLPGYRSLTRSIIYWINEWVLSGLLKPDSVKGKMYASIAKYHIKKVIKDPELQKKVTPDYSIGCKRILLANSYYPALNRKHVDVITDGVERIGEDHIVTRSGETLPVDAIIWGTGFNVTEPLEGTSIIGMNGVDLNGYWQKNQFENYYGTMVSGFPNCFMLAGPNTGIGHTSLVFMIESQINLILQCIESMEDRDGKALNVRADAQKQHYDALQEKSRGTAWTSGCNSWYLGENGQNLAIWPDYTFKYWWQTRKMNKDDFQIVSTLSSRGTKRPKKAKGVTP